MAENRGGRRAGAGRKPVFGLSEREMKRLLSALKREGKENHHGKTWQRKFAEHLYSDNASEALPFFKMLTEKLFVAGSVSETTSHKGSVGIYLPEKRPVGEKAALKVVEGGKGG